MKKIAYLAPEIPALSATFVYYEIIEMQKLGVNVLPISIHCPKSPAQEKLANKIQSKTTYLYSNNFLKYFVFFLKGILSSPLRFLQTLGVLLADCYKGLHDTNYNFPNLSTKIKFLTILKLIYQFFISFQLSILLKRHRIEHLHIHFAHVPVQIGMYSCYFLRIPYTFTSHANDLFERGFLLSEKIQRSLYGITISQYNEKFLHKQGVNPDKIKIVRCGIDSHQNMYTVDLDKKSYTLGSLARLVEKKGMDDFLQACSLLLQKGIPIDVHIGGDGPEKERLQRLCTDLQLGNAVTFFGNIAHDKVYPWLCNLDLFVLACKKSSKGDMDGIPLVLMEAMNIGIPVVSTRISAIEELLEDGKNAFTARSNDPVSLANSIEKYLTLEKPNKEKLIQQAKQKLQQDFDRTKNVIQLKGYIYER
ncbi:MAG: glycosyltransferase [Spirochaetota bacterium]